MIAWDHQESLWSYDHQVVNLFFTLALCLPFCVEVFEFEREVVYSQYWVVIPQWRSLCGRSCVDLVKILLFEGGDVKQWLGSWNISLYLCLIYSLSLYLALQSLFYFYTLDIVYVCPYLCWTKWASYSTSTLNLEESWGDSPKPFTGNLATLFGYTLCVVIEF